MTLMLASNGEQVRVANRKLADVAVVLALLTDTTSKLYNVFAVSPLRVTECAVAGTVLRGEDEP